MSYGDGILKLLLRKWFKKMSYGGGILKFRDIIV